MSNLSDAAITKEQGELYTPQFETDHSIVIEFYVILKENDDNRMLNYIYRNIYKLLDFGVIGRNEAVLQILVNDRFLSYLNKLTEEGGIDFSSDDYKYKLNRICYDYLKTADHNIFIQNVLLNIVSNINNRMMYTLIGFGLTKDQAAKIVCARYSTSTDLRINYKRTVRTIQTMPSSVMTEQNIVHIFDKTCTESVTELFIAIMYDSYSTFYSKEEEDVYGTISLAILDILESIPIEGIHKVISSYMRIQSSMDRRPRFALKSTSVGDYPRINQVIDMLESQGIYVY